MSVEHIHNPAQQATAQPLLSTQCSNSCHNSNGCISGGSVLAQETAREILRQLATALPALRTQEQTSGQSSSTEPAP